MGTAIFDLLQLTLICAAGGADIAACILRVVPVTLLRGGISEGGVQLSCVVSASGI